MFQDEAGFGRINKPKRCWAPSGVRPTVPCQRIREYTYAYAAVSPKDGEMVSLVLPYANTDCMNIFLEEVSRRYPDEYILMVADNAAWHRSKGLKLPENMEIFPLLPYSPELNPTEQIWDETREKGFKNELFKTLAAVESRLCDTLADLENNKGRVQSITGWDWIIKALSNAN
ncbi:transposase [Candidatus Desulfosporosinus infrequens]|uniref:Transposase n=1 Tax=Candidatus Desulfosporosinus infrequens TaxID=2043169 RepID=A0A2U3K5W1_9FIRM|nr:transposase [Candidatus Desulfosporosinus infrequens]